MNPFKALAEIISVNIKNISQTFSMAGSALKKHYSGSLFGWAWSIVRPLVFIGVYWFAIAYGIRGNKPIELEWRDPVPFILWMIPGVITWFLLQETLSDGVMCIRKNSHLVNKMVFPIPTIPVFSVISYCFSHLLLIAITVIVFLLAPEVGITIKFIQIIYYFLAYFLFCCIMATFISTLGVISRDFEQLIKAIMNVFFWLSPVLWSMDKISEKQPVLALIIKLNPYNYFIEGYRASFLDGKWFWERYAYTGYTWGFMLIFALLTAHLFKKLSSEFADVL